MNDQFLYDLRESPSAEFAKQLQQTLDSQPDSKRNRFPWLLPILAVGCAFAFVYQRSSHQASNPTPQPSHIVALTPKVPPPQLNSTVPQLAPSTPGRTPTPVASHINSSGISTLLLSGTAQSDTAGIPLHWHLVSQRAGAAQQYFEAGRDSSVVYNGSYSAYLKSKSTTLDQNISGSLSQLASATPYGGKKVEFSAFLRSQNVANMAGLWIRAEDSKGGVVLFRNVANPLANGKVGYVRGSNDWSQMTLTVDVPVEAVSLFYGVQLIGSGEVWVDTVQFSITGDADPAHTHAVPTSYNTPVNNPSLPPPSNLDFEQ